MYKKEKLIEEIEHDFDYKSDEESVYESFSHESKNMPPHISQKFSIYSESSESQRLVKDMIKRFRERT